MSGTIGRDVDSRLTEPKVAELARKAENNVASARSHDRLMMHNRAGSEFRNAAEIYVQLAEDTGRSDYKELAAKSYRDAGLSFMAHAHFIVEKINMKSRMAYKTKDIADACSNAIECFGKSGDKRSLEQAQDLLKRARASGYISEMKKHSRGIAFSSHSISVGINEIVGSGIDIRLDKSSKETTRALLRTIEHTIKELDESAEAARKLLGKAERQKS
ncbi:MAG: hypothetical protein KGH58_01795 [Candidatus Micrarchaeota archaeon]|nr:hypothetical protein [Candidatus Micrarchaeota archaeon]